MNATLVVPDDELQFLTAAFGPNATANSSGWVSTPSAGLGSLDAAPVRRAEEARRGLGPSILGCMEAMDPAPVRRCEGPRTQEERVGRTGREHVHEPCPMLTHVPSPVGGCAEP